MTIPLLPVYSDDIFDHKPVLKPCFFCSKKVNTVHRSTKTPVCAPCSRTRRVWDIPVKKSVIKKDTPKVAPKKRVKINWKKLVPLICDTCGCLYEVSEKHYRVFKKEGKSPRCRVCANRVAAAMRVLKNQEMREYALPESSQTPPKKIISLCGFEILPAERGRCKEFLTCSNYDDCLDLIADRAWNGFKLGGKHAGKSQA